jgi:hypothetical protein
MATAANWAKKNISAPDEVREFPNGSGSMKVLKIGEETVGYATFKPGWKWSKDMKPKVGGDACQVTHNLYCISGRMGVRMADGTEFEIGPGYGVKQRLRPRKALKLRSLLMIAVS